MKRTVAVISVFIALLAAKLKAGEIHDAAAAGDLTKVKALLEADPTLLESKDDRPQFYGSTPLMSACWGPGTTNQQATVANYLIDKGADINVRSDSGATPLYFATKNFDLTQRLIAMKADVNVRAFMPEYTPLHEAAISGNLKVAKLLIDHGADPNFHGAIGTVLQKVIYNKSQSGTEMAELLLKNGARIDQKFSFGNTELHLAVLRHYAEIIPILLKYGADINAVNEYGHTPLYYAARHGYREIAETLISAGAKKSAIVEANYSKAPQLTAKLKGNEAYLWYLGGTSLPYNGYAVKTKDHLLLFNPTEIDDSSGAGLANGRLNPSELAGQKITGLILNSSYQGQSGPSISELGRRLPGINIVLNFKPAESSSELPRYHVVAPHENFSVHGIQIHTIPAIGRVGYLGEGLGYLVEADGVKVFHAGLHAAANNDASQLEGYRKEIDFLKPFGPIDIAILPISGRHITVNYESYLYLIDQLSPKAIYLIGDDLTKEEHRKCIEVLRARKVPVFYPEGGIAVGERFRYFGNRAPDGTTALPVSQKNQRASTQARDAAEHANQSDTARTGEYFGQNPPSATPQIFAPGLISKDGLLDGGPYFTPDGNEVIWRENLPPGPDKGWVFRAWTMRCQNGVWSAPHPPPFAGTGSVMFSPDGHRAYFSPFRSGTADDIWFAERKGDSWSEPKCLNFVSRWPELKYAYVKSIARNGNIYFVGYAQGLFDNSGIYRARLVNGDYTKPELLPRNINLPPFLNWTPFVAPDESYLLFSSTRTGSHGLADLFISFRNSGDSWTDPISLGEPINTEEQERYPAVSPDGKYLFFTRGHDAVHNVYWVDASVLEPLRLQARGWTNLTGDYLGQKPPGATPQVFARGIVSTDDKEHSTPAFSPDGNEVFWREARPPGPNNSAWLAWGITMRRENGRWSAPRLSPYPNISVFSVDGKRQYFGAPRPRAASKDPQLDIWVIEKKEDGWSEPKCLNLISQSPELQFAAWPTIARNGNLYFISGVPEQRNGGIARAEFINGQYAKPELLPKNINMVPYRNWAPFIAPDESYLLFSSNRPGSLDNEGDLYISRPLADGSWTDPVRLGAPINTEYQERFSGLSPDGKYFFFTRWSPGHDEDVYWVEAASVPELRSKLQQE